MNAAVESWQGTGASRAAVTRRPTLAPLDLPELLDLADRLADVEGFVPRALLGRPPAILATLLAGAELGLGPMESLRAIHVIEGRVTLSAEVARALYLAAGHELVVEASDTKAIARARRRDSANWTTLEWTIDRAKRANLAGRATWRNYPRQMLTARVTGEITHLVAPDALAGLDVADEVEIAEAEGVAEVEPQPARKRIRAPRASVPAPALTPPGDEQPAQSPETAAEPRPAVVSPAYPPRPSDVNVPPLPGENEQPSVSAQTDESTPPARPSTPADTEAQPEQPRPLSATMRRVHARMNETFPNVDRATLDTYRHALVAIVTRNPDVAPGGPYQSSFALDDNLGAQMGFDTLLNLIQAGEATITRNPNGSVALRHAPFTYRVTFDPLKVVPERDAP